MKPFIVFAVALAPMLPAQSDQQIASIGDFQTESGAVIRDCRIGYRTFGQLNADRSNAVLFPTWFSGRSENLATLIGPGKLVDDTQFFVIAADALGNGVSSSPSNSPAPFPAITIRDMVNAHHRLVAGHLKLPKLHAVLGISMGGMQTFQWMVSYPDFFDRAVPIAGSPQLSSSDLLLWQAELSAIETAQASGGDMKQAMRVVNQIHQFALFTPEYRDGQTSHAAFAAFLKDLDATSGRMAPQDWAAQLRAMMSHDIAKAAGGALEKVAGAVKARTLVIAATQDHMVSPFSAVRFARLIGAELMELTGNCGHQAVNCEAGQVHRAAARFLKR
jgi:homoserine O-acetyltransferase